MNRRTSSERRLRNALTAIGALYVMTAGPVHAADPDPNKVIDLRADILYVQGADKSEKTLDGAVWVQKAIVTEGNTVSLTCDSSANLVGAAYWKTNVTQTWQVIIKRDGGTLGFGPVSMPAGTQLGGKSSSGLDWPSPYDPNPWDASSENFGTAFKGSMGPVKWTAKGIGLHKFECVVPKTGFEEPSLANNITAAVVEVIAKKTIAPGVFPLYERPKTGSATTRWGNAPHVASNATVAKPPTQKQDWSQAAPAASSVAKAPQLAAPAPQASARDATADALSRKLGQLTERIKTLERGGARCSECGDLTKRVESVRRQIVAGLSPGQTQQLTLETDRIAADLGRLEAARGLPAVQGPRAPEPPVRTQPSAPTR